MVTRLTEPDPARLSAGQPCGWWSTPVASTTTDTVVDLRLRTPGRPVNGVDIAGVGIHPFGRFEDRTITDMGVAAVQGCAGRGGRGAEAGSRPPSAPPPTAGVASGHKVLSRLGMTGMPIVDVEAGCASGAAALMLGAAAIRAGGLRHRARLRRGEDAQGHDPVVVLRAVAGGVGPGRHARLLRPAGPAPHAGLGRDQGPPGPGGGEEPAPRCAQPRRHVPIRGRRRRRCWGRGWCASRCTCGCSARPTRGAAAVGAAAGPRTPAAPAVRAAAVAAVLRSHLPGSVLNESTPMSGLRRRHRSPPPSTLAATAAYEEAGIGPDDLDVVECQDTDAARELLSYEELGLCAPGRRGRTARRGRHRARRAHPGQPERGAAVQGRAARGLGPGPGGHARPPAAGRGGANQVERRPVGLAHTVGRGANASVVVLSR